jgi:hypothetical protein
VRLVCELRYVGLLELGLQMVVGYVAHGLLEVGQQNSGSQKPRPDLYGSTREKRRTSYILFLPLSCVSSCGGGGVCRNQNHAEGDTDYVVARVGVVLCPWLPQQASSLEQSSGSLSSSRETCTGREEGPTVRPNLISIAQFQDRRYITKKDRQSQQLRLLVVLIENERHGYQGRHSFLRKNHTYLEVQGEEE